VKPLALTAVLALLLLAGCGGSSKTTSTSTTTAAAPNPSDAMRALIVKDPSLAGKVTLTILGPQPGAMATKLPQVAIQFSAKTPFVESGLWVDGLELVEKGGGSPTRGTIYGAPAASLKAGEHVAVGYARTALSGHAVAWVFNVG
jgi:hypothetical protein